MVGKTISHYKVLEKLGGGGMGVVYKAQDLKLDRFVALKFLPHHLSADEEEKKRFIHEAKAASALDHPNICTIYEIDETEDGQIFICMAYYEGETLKAREVDYHTDIWSFGVLIYEMLTGQLPFKGEYDQAVMYSIMNVEPEPIIPTGSGRTGVPMELERIVNKALAKNPNARYQHVDELLVDLKMTNRAADIGAPGKPFPTSKLVFKKQWHFYAGAITLIFAFLLAGNYWRSKPVEKINSIAVLPLENISGDPEQEYFVDGMTESLIANLAKIGSLRVISRTTVMQYKKARKMLPEIAKESKQEYINPFWDSSNICCSWR